MTAGLSIPLPSNHSLNFLMVNPTPKKQSDSKTSESSELSLPPCNKKTSPQFDTSSSKDRRSLNPPPLQPFPQLLNGKPHPPKSKATQKPPCPPCSPFLRVTKKHPLNLTHPPQKTAGLSIALSLQPFPQLLNGKPHPPKAKRLKISVSSVLSFPPCNKKHIPP
jgi:hypothetical protein